jgi:hypothetical protein
MTLTRRVWLAALSLIVSLAVSFFIFSKKWGAKDDLEAYLISPLGLIFAVIASALFYPVRNRISIRLFCIVAFLVTIFWGVEFFGGVAWFVLDKLTRSIQKL